MTRKIVLIAIYKNIIWKETAKYLKYYRVKNFWDLDSYNIIASKIIWLYRKIEFKIDTENLKINKCEYIKMIKELEKGK